MVNDLGTLDPSLFAAATPRPNPVRLALNYLRLRRVNAHVPGWTEFYKLKTLFHYAAKGPARGAIVECGTYCGRSAAALALGSMASKRERVIAIDTFATLEELRDFDNRVAAAFEAVASEHGVSDVYEAFEIYMRKAGCRDHVVPIRMKTEDAVHLLGSQPFIRLLHLDGGHAYETVRSDLENYMPLVLDKGIICLDDYSPGWPDCKRAIDEFLTSHSETYQVVRELPRYLVVQKRGGVQNARKH